jgi:hypothetical protein
VCVCVCVRVQVYTETPSFGNVFSLAALKQHAASSSDYVGKLETLIAAYGNMLTSVGGTPTAAARRTASVSVVEPSSAAAGPAPASAAATPTNANNKTATGSSAARQSVVAGPTGKAAVRASVATKAAAAPATPAKDPTCTVLYDFEATGEGELSVREGAVLPLLSTSDPDWWTIEVDGQIGYVPASYVRAN